jgi:hypothetical protein
MPGGTSDQRPGTPQTTGAAGTPAAAAAAPAAVPRATAANSSLPST